MLYYSITLYVICKDLFLQKREKKEHLSLRKNALNETILLLRKRQLLLIFS